MIIIYIRSEKNTFFVASQILGILPNKRSVNLINNKLSHPDASYQDSSQLTFRFSRRRKKKYFQDGGHGHGSHLGLRIGKILATFALQDTLIPSFKSVGLSVQEKKRKIDFQDGGHLGFPIGMILAIIDLQVNWGYFWSTSYQVSFSWPSGSREEANNRFWRWPPQWPSWISDRNNFSYFDVQVTQDGSYQVSGQLALRFRRRSEK